MSVDSRTFQPLRAGLARTCRAFAQAEDGALLVFGLIIFVLMLMVSGIAVDLMRYESERVRLQGTSDRAVLAGTSLLNSNVTMTPTELTQAYFDAEGLGEFASGNISVTESAETGRTVRVTPSGRLNTLFLRMSGLDHLDMNAPAAAVEARAGGPGGARTKLEIVMVLDKSGSMGRTTSTGRTRMEEQKLAAKSFVDAMLTGYDANDISISLVKYDAWVLPWPGLVNALPNVGSGGNGACVEFEDWRQARNGTVLRKVDADLSRKNCRTGVQREMLPMLSDPDTIKDSIDQMSPGGTTSIDLGVRMGAMLFDPLLRSHLESLVDDGVLPETVRGRPFDWNTPNVKRALILLTDGANCCGARFNRSEQDENTRAVCEDLRNNEVFVYTVAFDAPQVGVDLLAECASSDGHFFNSDGDGLIEAFGTIGKHIRTQSLRLVQ